jgi:predicted MPP superfamily phosphohydrolase
MRVRREVLKVPGLNSKLAGYKILHVSDIHFDEKVGNDRELWDHLHSGMADLILITGDFVTHDRNIDPVVEFLAGSTARDGIYGILGNHDYALLTLKQHFLHGVMKREFIANDWRRMNSLLAKADIRVLVNEFASIRTSSGAGLFVEGTDDPVRGHPRITDSSPEYDSADLSILMSHSPDILYSDEIKKKKFDILLSGHTHGGQIRVPGIGALLTGTRYATRRESYGTYRTSGGMFVNVSAGIGYSLLPIRINCPAELILIELAS